MKISLRSEFTLCIIVSYISQASFVKTNSMINTLIRIKLKSLQFENNALIEYKVTSGYETTDEEAQHLTRLMRESSKKTNLDLTFSREIYNRNHFNPIMIHRKLCNEFHASRVIQPLTNTFFLVNDDAEEAERMSADRGIEYILYLLASMNIPVITWFPDRAGQMENTEHSLALRLEPMNWHIARALLDFMHAYNWNVVTLMVSISIPDYKVFIKEFKKVQKEQNDNTFSNNFEFTISKIHRFQGINIKELHSCMSKRLSCPVIKGLLIILEKIYKNNDRIIIFHGRKEELIIMLWAVKRFAIGPKKYLLDIFGNGYLWIGTPALMSPIEATKRSATLQQESIVIHNWMSKQGMNISGMFFLSTLNHFSMYKEKSNFVRQLWQKSLLKLVNFIDKKNMNNSELLRQHVVPHDLCTNNETAWKFGKRFFKILKSETIEYNGEYIGFLPNGLVNTSSMFIFNSKMVDNRMKWFKVGSWSMSSKWGKNKTKVRIDGVTWPGDSNKPPKGRPDKFKLKVATIQETPFIIYGKVQDNGNCDANAIPCRVRPKEGDIFLNNVVVENDEEEDIHEEISSKRNITSNINKVSPMYVPACCAGLTIDLLNELMKDLNFMVDLFEVPDGKWGGWTPDGWNGLVKELIDHKADMVVTSLKITPNRSEQIDFSVPFMETGIAIIVALRKGAISPKAFLEPYDFASWCVILIFSVHACGAALFIYEWLSPQGLDKGNASITGHKFSLCRSLWLIWSMLFGAAVNTDNPRGVASRFLANIWALFALIFLASYTANLAAFMIAKDDYFELEGIKDWRLLNPQSHIPTFRFATVPSGATEENIKINFPKMYTYIRGFNKSSVDDGIKAVRTGEIDAFIYDSNVLDYKAAKDKRCKLKTVGNLYAMTGYGIGFPKGSKWRQKINALILHYQRYGKLQRWKRFWMTGQCKKLRTLDSTNKTLGVTNFISAFILLLGGMVIGCLLLLLEHIFYRYLKSRVKSIDKYGCCRLVSLSLGQIMSFEETIKENVNVVKSMSCSNHTCHEYQLKIKNENNQLIKKIQKLESDLNQMKESVSSTVRISPFDRDTEMLLPLREYRTVPHRRRQQSNKNNENPANLLTSRSTVYSCKEKSGNISLYCPKHIEQLNLEDTSEKGSIIKHESTPNRTVPNYEEACQLISQDLNNKITSKPSHRYKIIKSKLPQNFYKFPNGSNSPFVSAFSKFKRRRNEMLEKESCL